MNSINFHPVILDPEKCKGCVTCMKRCPTEAIRVRNGKASIFYDRCIGCGECVRLCPHHAKLASYDLFECINDFKYKIAIPAPSLYGQFNNLTNVDTVLNGLIAIGFDDVFEVGRSAELVSEASKIMLDKGKIQKPVISTACPAVLELISVKYKNLVPNLLNLLAPVDIAAKLARERAESAGISKDDIGVFFISPCPAKVFALKNGLGVSKPLVDGVLAISDIYLRLLPAMKNLTELKPLSKMGAEGLNWATSSGEATGTGTGKYLAADGIENVINVLNNLESSTKLRDVDFIELNACTSGCVGGVLNIENPFVAKARLRELSKKLPNKLNNLADVGKGLDFYLWEKTPDYREVYCVDENRTTAIQKLIEVENILKDLPLVDCGLCGAPSCRAFAEDIVSGVIPADTKCLRLVNDDASLLLDKDAK
ncbi:MAG: [Fe-Fe] hydrogenase large subunit C-terminal domain-containing protein [Clostridia bacterium]|nr:[Fe-Fe] hydrogenase large subunit C-terminal domain-containing protein [Clostridia bacterium]